MKIHLSDHFWAPEVPSLHFIGQRSSEALELPGGTRSPVCPNLLSLPPWFHDFCYLPAFVEALASVPPALPAVGRRRTGGRRMLSPPPHHREDWRWPFYLVPIRNQTLRALYVFCPPHFIFFKNASDVFLILNYKQWQTIVSIRW